MNQRFFSTVFFVAMVHIGYVQASQASTQLAQPVDRERKVKADFLAVSHTLIREYKCVDVPLSEASLLTPDTADGLGQTQKRFLKLAVELQYLENKKIAATCSNHSANAIFRLQKEAVHDIYACHDAQSANANRNEALEIEKARAYVAAYQEGLRFRAALLEKKQ